MEKFKISDIQEMFVSDVERFHNLTQQHVRDLLDAAAPSQESLDEALRQCHTLKGLAGSVEAWGLSCLGADFERLLELAGSWMGTERERANQIFEFILEHLQDWFVMNQFSCMDMLPQAWDIYQGLRVLMEDRWPGCLPPSGAHAGTELAAAQYVRLPDLQITEAEAAPVPAGSLTIELDVQGAAPAAECASSETPVRDDASSQVDAQRPGADDVASAKAPLPVRVVPPVLRHRDAAAPPQVSAEPSTAASTASDNLRPGTGEAGAPSVIPARADAGQATGASPAEKREPAPTPAPTTPPLLRVAPPTLKRRSQPATPAPEAKTAATANAGTSEVASKSQLEPEAQSSAAPNLTPASSAAKDATSRDERADGDKSRVAGEIPPVPSTATNDAEALFASLPESVAAEPAAAAAPEPAATGEFVPGADNDLLVLLSQEVAGYLVELTGSLMALAGNLAATEPWDQARRLFHTIKGTAATFGLDAVSGPAKAGETRCAAAVEKVRARTRKAFEECVHRAGVVARALSLPFDEGRLRAALERGLAEAANAAAASAPVAPPAGLDPEMAGFFINDARDQIAVIEQAVLRWEQGEQPGAQVQAAQRGFHTIKGAGNSIGLTAVAASVHQVESFLETVAGQGAAGSKAVFTFLLGAVDQLRGYLQELTGNPDAAWRHDWTGALQLLAAGGPETSAPKPATALAAAVPAERKESAGDGNEANYLRIETTRLHQLMDLIGELVIDRARLARKIEQLAELHRALGERNGALSGSVLSFQEQFEFNLKSRTAGAGGPGATPGVTKPFEKSSEPVGREAVAGSREPGQASAGFTELEFDRYDRFNELARSLVEVSHDIAALNAEVTASLEQLAAEHETVAATSRALQGRVAGLTLVPVRELFPRLERAFRDALSVSGKSAALEFTGGEGLLDKAVVDRVYGPLLHLVRNAVAHGVETAPRRRELGKAERGQVRLSARQEANQFVLELADDGAGVDAAAVRARAIARGWLAETAPELTAEQVSELIFRPGFSTAETVSSVAGRGVGLDVVRREVENLNGSVELRWVAGQGTTWRLRLPLTLSVSEAVLAVVGGGSPALREQNSETAKPGAGGPAYTQGSPVPPSADSLAAQAEDRGEPSPGASRSTLRAAEAHSTEGGVVFAFPLNFVESGLILEEATRRSESGVELYPVARRWTESQIPNPKAEIEKQASAIANPLPAAAPDSSGRTEHRLDPPDADAEIEWLPVLRLSQWFGLGGRTDSNKALILAVGGRRVIVVVEAVLTRQEIVVKPLDAVLGAHPLLNGASLDAEGRVIPILNLPALLQAEAAGSKFQVPSPKLQVAGSPDPGTASNPQSTTSAPPPEHQAPAQAVPTRVLVVDDSLSVRKVQARFLRDLGCAVTVARDGVDALEQLRAAPFDFIFTDLEMPRLNGYELISEVRGNPAWAQVPVAVISSRSADKYITKALNLGACTFLTKPFTQEQLRQVLSRFLSPVAD